MSLIGSLRATISYSHWMDVQNNVVWRGTKTIKVPTEIFNVCCVYFKMIFFVFLQNYLFCYILCTFFRYQPCGLRAKKAFKTQCFIWTIFRWLIMFDIFLLTLFVYRILMYTDRICYDKHKNGPNVYDINIWKT